MWTRTDDYLGEALETIQVTIDEALLTQVDQMIEALNITRSAFICDALRLALRRYRVDQMERRHAAGFAQKFDRLRPVAALQGVASPAHEPIVQLVVFVLCLGTHGHAQTTPGADSGANGFPDAARFAGPVWERKRCRRGWTCGHADPAGRAPGQASRL